jgi:hypothetical protein
LVFVTGPEPGEWGSDGCVFWKIGFVSQNGPSAKLGSFRKKSHKLNSIGFVRRRTLKRKWVRSARLKLENRVEPEPRRFQLGSFGAGGWFDSVA